MSQLKALWRVFGWILLFRLSRHTARGFVTTGVHPTPYSRSLQSTPDDNEDDSWSSVSCALNLDDLSRPFLSPLDSESTFVEFTEDGLCLPAGPEGQFKEKLARFLALSRVELAISGMVLLNSLLVALSTLEMPSESFAAIRIAEQYIGTGLLVEFACRWYSSSKDSGRHVLNPQFAIDVVAVILPVLFTLEPSSFWASTPVPSWLTSPSGIFNLQLLRVFRLQRVLRDMDTFTKFERALGISLNGKVRQWQLQLARVLLSLFTLLSVSTGLIYAAEREVNPNIGDYFTALYFGLTTLTTVGYGDITPVTVAGKFVVCSSIIAGVAIVPAQAAALVEALLARQESRKPKKKVPKDKLAMNSFSNKVLDTSMICENCGSNLHWADARYCYYCGEDL